MKSSAQILAEFKMLDSRAQETLLQSLRVEFEGKGKMLEVANSDIQSNGYKKCCPHCQSSRVHKRGAQNNVQMYRCVTCTKWFSATTGTPLWDIKRKDKWQSYLNCMQQNMPIKKIAKEIGISVQTSFDWRHKILSVLNTHSPSVLTGRIECDELELPISNKGERNLQRKPHKRSGDFKRNTMSNEVTTIQVITAVDENNNKYLQPIETKRITAKQLSKTLGKRIDKKATLITDMHPSYRPFVKTKPGLTHKVVKAKEHVSKTDRGANLQKVNNTHKQLRQFLGRFNGVSTKYLSNYLNWFAYGKYMEQAANQIKQWFYAIITSDAAYNLYQLLKQNAVNIRT